ncbi:Tfp pilus assembly protein FimT/FimU [Candidatus Dependentiae bacterium]
MQNKNLKFGFSLLELIIVVAAIVILFTLTIPKMSFLNNFLLKNEVDRLYCTFSFLQQRAIASNSEQKLFFDMNKNTYFFIDKNNKKNIVHLPKMLRFGFLYNSYGPPSNPIKIIDKAITFNKGKKNSISFFSNGRIQSGTAYIVDKNKNFMCAITTGVSQKSFIRKYFYQNGKWIKI